MSLVGNLLQIQTSSNTDSMEEGEEDAVSILQRHIRTYSIIDLLLILLPHLSVTKKLQSSQAQQSDFTQDSPISIFYQVLIAQIADPDVTIQKRTYKALNKVVEILLPTDSSFDMVHTLLSDLTSKLVDPTTMSNIGSGAKKNRMELISKVVTSVPLISKDMISENLLFSFIQAAVTEVTLTTKEASEKARSAAYDTLAVMANRMIEAGKKFGFDGSVVGGSLMEVDPNGEVTLDGDRKKLNFNEFIAMVVAGLAGESNTQSAAISCVAKLLFEFKGKKQ